VEGRAAGYTAGVRIAGCAALAAALLSTGCLVLALQPAYGPDDVTFDEGLIGHWVDAEDATTADIQRGEWRSYRVAFTDRFTTYALQGNLTRAGALTLLDLTQSRGEDAGPMLIPVHAVYRIERRDDTLTAAALDYDWFSDALAGGALRPLAAAFDGRRNVIVSSITPELRQWLSRAPAAAFAAPMTFTRKTP
jgi:hypothetical protein